MIRDIQDEIMRLKKENDIYVLAHSYQAREIVEVADYMGDSFQLSVQAGKVPQKKIVMCGVRFMAETVKILSPGKAVYLANPEAGCPMAEQMDKELIRGVLAKDPHYTVVCYINTTADLKTVCDVCVTSSSAVKIINKLENKDILFSPDINLGQYVADQCPDKNIKLLQGGCPVHAAVDKQEVEKMQKKHPGALLLVHPECQPEVVQRADFVGSTSAILDYAKKSTHKEFIIGTEMSIAEHLQYDCPDKKFYYLSQKLICSDMKVTTLMDLYNCVSGVGGEEIILSDETIRLSKKCIDKMIELG
jgi:quinolinate synthase